MEINKIEEGRPCCRDGEDVGPQQNQRRPSRGALLVSLFSTVGFVAFMIVGLGGFSDVETGRASRNSNAFAASVQANFPVNQACPADSPSGGFNIEMFTFESTSNMPDFQNQSPDQTFVASKLWYPLIIGPWDGFSVSENFAMKVTGFLVVETPGTYEFLLGADDESILFIGNEVVVDNSGASSFQVETGQITLSSGAHLIQVFAQATSSLCVCVCMASRLWFPLSDDESELHMPMQISYIQTTLLHVLMLQYSGPDTNFELVKPSHDIVCVPASPSPPPPPPSPPPSPPPPVQTCVGYCGKQGKTAEGCYCDLL